MRNPGIRLLASLGAVLCLAPSLFAQDALHGRIEGTVTDSVHATLLGGVSVRATRLGVAAETTLLATTDARGRYRFDALDAGRYAVTFSSAFLDSLEFGAPVPQVSVVAGQLARVDLAVPSSATLQSAACPGRVFEKGTGALIGHVVDATNEGPLRAAEVLATWNDVTVDEVTHVSTSKPRREHATANPDGQYRFCELPTNTKVVIQVAHGGRIGPVLQLSIADSVGVTIGNVLFSGAAADVSAPSGTALLTGSVRGAGGQAVSGAQVSVMGAAARSDERGRFSLSGLPTGLHDVEVRRLGYRVERRQVELRGGEMVRQDFQLERVVMLDSVAVIAQRVRYPDFELHRKMAFGGKFITEADLDFSHVTTVSDIVRRTAGWQGRIVGQGSNARIPGCAVLVDNLPTLPVVGVNPPGGQLNMVNMNDVGALELYRNDPGYQAVYNSSCVIMIWTKSWANLRAKKPPAQ